MKVKNPKKRCANCQYVKRRGIGRIVCKTNARHNVRAGTPKQPV